MTPNERIAACCRVARLLDSCDDAALERMLANPAVANDVELLAMVQVELTQREMAAKQAAYLLATRHLEAFQAAERDERAKRRAAEQAAAEQIRRHPTVATVFGPLPPA